jgi:pimeloyl-ACP methyl ester carboxylesterase
MEQDPNFRELGSTMGWAYGELLGRPFDVGHYYLYVPQDHPPGRLPVILFLHGNAGNFKSYTWVWSHLAEACGMVIIAPSFGFGNWQQPGGVAAALRALEEAATVVEIDPARVYPAGLSNGGLGVSRAAAAAAQRFRGLIFISPVMDTAIVNSPTFHTRWAGRPALVVTGETDRRVPLSYVDRRVAALRAGGVPVTYITYPAEDHFLFFSRREEMLEDIAAWLEQTEKEP